LIRYLQHNEIDKEKWDACIKGSFNSMAYAASWYLDQIHEDWEALVEDDYERVMPLTGRKKFGVYYLFQPYFVQQLGVFSKSILTPGIIKNFINNIPEKFQFVDIKLNSFNNLSDKSLDLQPNRNYVLDLIHDYNKLYSRYSSNTKRNLKKSANSNLSLVKNIKPEAIITLFRDNRGKNLKNWTDSHYLQLQKLIYLSIHNGKGITYGVFTEHNQLCAGAFFLSSSNRLIFLFSGADKTALETGAMPLLIDEVIKEYAPGNLVLDFEGSNDDNLARFYKGFGAKESSYLSLKINRLKFPMKSVLNVYQWLKK
jgi:hypothetical protein